MGWTNPRTWAVGEVITAAIMNTHVRDNLLFLRQDYFYTQFTTPVTVTSTSEAAPNLVVTSGSQSYDGSGILIEFFSLYVLVGVANIVFSLWDGATNLGILGELESTSDGPVHLARKLTPTAAAHEYRIQAWNRSAATASVSAGSGGAGNYLPGYIRVTGS